MCLLCSDGQIDSPDFPYSDCSPVIEEMLITHDYFSLLCALVTYTMLVKVKTIS